MGPMGDNSRWILLLIWGSGGLGTLLLVWTIAVRWVWMRRRRRMVERGICLKCRYDLTQTSTGICPECGTEIANAENVPPAKANPYLVLLGVALIVVSLNAHWISQRSREGAAAFIPTTVLVFAAPVPREVQDSDVFRSVRSRLPLMWWWQKRIGEWRESRSWSAAEIDTLIATREVWPAGGSICFVAKGAPALSTVFGERTIRVRRAGEKEPEFGLLCSPTYGIGNGIGVPYRSLVLKPQEPGKYAQEFYVTVTEPTGKEYSAKIKRTYRVVQPWEVTLKPIRAAGVDKAIRESLVAEARILERTRETYEAIAYLNAGALEQKFYAVEGKSGLTLDHLALTIEILDGEKVLFRRVSWGRGQTIDIFKDPAMQELAIPAPGQDRCFYLPDAVVDRLVVRVRDNEGLVATNLDVDRFWSGDFRVPLREILEEGHR